MSTSPPGSSYYYSDNQYSPEAAVGVSNGVLLAAVIFLAMVLAFVFLLYLYSKRYLGSGFGSDNEAGAMHFIFASSSPVAARGLSAEALRAIPTTTYLAKDFETPLECAVCLSELADGDTARLLPKCGHGFHAECVDMWLHSHTNCPLCRAPVDPFDVGVGHVELLGGVAAPVTFPTNTLFWGTDQQVNGRAPAAAAPVEAAQPSSSSSSSGLARKGGHLAIDIPRRAADGLPSPVSSGRVGAVDDLRSPLSARLRSLTRLLSGMKPGGAAAAGSSSSPSMCAGDVEQGLPATTPRAARSIPVTSGDK